MMDQYKSPFGEFTDKGEFMSPTSALSSGMESQPSIFGFSAEGPKTGDVTNTTQDASKTSGNLMSALDAVNKFYKEGMKGMYEGIAIPGDENIRMHTGLQGQRYFTLRTTPTSSTDIYGRTTTGKDMPKETISFGIPRDEPQQTPATPQSQVNPTAASKAFSTPQGEPDYKKMAEARDLSNTPLPESEVDVERRAYDLKQQAKSLRDKRKQSV